MVDTPCCEVVWEYWLPIPFASFPSRASPCAITFRTQYITRELLQKSKWNVLQLHIINSYDNYLACWYPAHSSCSRNNIGHSFSSVEVLTPFLWVSQTSEDSCVILWCQSGRCGVGEVQWVDIMAREQATVLTCVPCDVIRAAAHTPWPLFTSRCIFKVDVCGFRSPAGFGPKRSFDFLCGRQTRIVHPVFPGSQGETVNSSGKH